MVAMFLLRADSLRVEAGRSREHMSPLYELGAIWPPLTPNELSDTKRWCAERSLPFMCVSEAERW